MLWSERICRTAIVFWLAVWNIAAGEIHSVPVDYPTIQLAIDAAQDGDTVAVQPGVYHESLHLSGKSIRLTSLFDATGDPAMIRRTILDGSIVPDPDPEDDIDAKVDQVIFVHPDAGRETIICGFTIRDGDDGISCHAQVTIVHNRFVNNVDGIDYEGGGGICRNNLFIANDDDGVDLDLACEVLVENNEIHDNDDDGIEFRLHPYQGKTLEIIIRNNRITGNGEDGIQLIDYPDTSDRTIRIEGNLIAYNAMAGIGCMSDGNTVEDYEAASIPEPLAIVNNTIAENQYGISGGDNVRLLNNVIMRNAKVGLKNVDGGSVATHNLLWKNGQSSVGTKFEQGVVLEKSPLLDDKFRPLGSSPCRTDGLAEWQPPSGEKLVPDAMYLRSGASILGGVLPE